MINSTGNTTQETIFTLLLENKLKRTVVLMNVKFIMLNDLVVYYYKVTLGSVKLVKW